MTAPLAYHAPEVLYEAVFRYRRPAVLAIGGLLIVVGPLTAAMNVATRLARHDYAFACFYLGLALLMTAAGAWLTWAFLSGRTTPLRITTDGVQYRTFRPWTAIARVGGNRNRNGIELELSLRYSSRLFGTAFTQMQLIGEHRLSEQAFADLMTALEAVQPDYFPHVWLDRHLEQGRRTGSMSLRVLTELNKRAKRA